MHPHKGFRRDAPVIGARESFLAPRPSRWRFNLGVLLLCLVMLQFVIFACHLLWLAELALGSFASRW
jgi:hypothetical protein